MVLVSVTTAKDISAEFKEIVQAHASIKSTVCQYGSWTWRSPWPFGMTTDPLVKQVEQFQALAKRLFDNVQASFQEKQLTSLFAEELKTKLKAMYWEPASHDILGKITKSFRGIFGFLVGVNTRDISQELKITAYNISQLSLFQFDTMCYNSNGDGTSGSFHLTKNTLNHEITVHQHSGAFTYEVLGQTTDTVQKAFEIAYKIQSQPSNPPKKEKWTLSNINSGQIVPLPEKFMTTSKMLQVPVRNGWQETYKQETLYGEEPTIRFFDCLPSCIQIIESQKIDENIPLERLTDCLYAFDYLNNDLGKQLVLDAIAKNIVSQLGKESLSSDELKQLVGYSNQVNTDLGVNLIASLITAMLSVNNPVGYSHILSIVKQVYSRGEYRWYEKKFETLRAIKNQGYNWNFWVREEMKNDKDIVIAALRANPSYIHQVSSDLTSDKEFMFEALTRLRNSCWSRSVFREGDANCCHRSKCACAQIAALKDDKEFMLKAIDLDSLFTADLSVRLKNDREVACHVAKKHSLSFVFMSDELKCDQESMLDAIEVNGFVTAYASNELKGDREFIRRAIERSKGGIFVLYYASDALKKDKELVLRAVGLHGDALQCADSTLRKSKEFVLKALERSRGHLWTLYWADEDLKNDRDVVLKAVTLNGWSLQCASADLKNDKEIVLKALETDGKILEFASEELQKDEEVLLKARLK